MVLLAWTPFPGSFLPKSIPIWALMLIVYGAVPGKRGKLLAFGLLLSSVGDVALTIHSPVGFMVGLGFFLLAHVVYAVNFLQKSGFVLARLPYYLAILAFSIAMAVWLAPNLGEMQIPVFAYLFVITCMAISAGMSKETRPILLLGAVIFMASDSIIAVSKFVGEVWGAKYWVMLTYYVAQGLIVWAFLPADKRADR
ncbi:MAG: lysoplasmalogenase [Bacteroidia bacterium]